MIKILYIRNDSLDPHYNLALEEFALKNLDPEESYIILWQNAPSVIIGRFQNTIEEINQDFIEKNKINVVRRMTGGGAVYHDLGNLNFSFIEKATGREIDFRKFTEPVVKALAKMGINAEHTGRNDITIDNKKFSGNAQYHYKGKVLHHGTILFNSKLENVQSALNVKKEKIESKGVKSVRSRVTNIVDYLENKVPLERFKELLLHYLFGEQEIKEYKLSSEEQEKIKKLMEDKYLTWEWNFGASPAFNLRKGFHFPGGNIDFLFNVEGGIIKNCTIFGDFFSNYDVATLADKFKGIKYHKEDIARLIQEENLEKYFGQISKESLIQSLF